MELDLMQLVANLVFLDIVTLGFLLNAEYALSAYFIISSTYPTS